MLHDLLFERQRAWSASRNIEALLVSYAEVIGLDRAAFEQALNDQSVIAALETARQETTDRGVQATPTFEVAGQLVSASKLDMAIEEALQQAGK